MIFRDALLAWIHFVFIFALVGVLAVQSALYKQQLELSRLRQLQRIDLGYGIIAGAVVLSGLARVFWGLKGASYYAHNPIFWTKMALFVAVALLSIAPTIHYRRLAGAGDGSGMVAVPDHAYATVRRLIRFELLLLIAIPLCASLMANGFR